LGKKFKKGTKTGRKWERIRKREERKKGKLKIKDKIKARGMK
jgi:hypothetical protein